MKFLNYTPHIINVTDAAGNLLQSFPSVGVARVPVVNSHVGSIGGIEIFVSEPKVGMASIPEPQDGVAFIVSTIVRTAFPDRMDLFSPGDLIRDIKGQPVGCRGLVRNF